MALAASPGVPHGREEQMIAGEQASPERAGNFRVAEASPTAHPLLERERAPSRATPTRAENQIGLTSQNRGQDQRQFGRIVVAIAVKENEDVGVAGGYRAGQACGPIATKRLSDDSGAGGGGDLRSAVSTAVVHDDDLVDEVARYLADDAADGCLLVQRRDHHADPHSPLHVPCSILRGALIRYHDLIAGLPMPTHSASHRLSHREDTAGFFEHGRVDCSLGSPSATIPAGASCRATANPAFSSRSTTTVGASRSLR